MICRPRKGERLVQHLCKVRSGVAAQRETKGGWSNGEERESVPLRALGITNDSGIQGHSLVWISK